MSRSSKPATCWCGWTGKISKSRWHESEGRSGRCARGAANLAYRCSDHDHQHGQHFTQCAVVEAGRAGGGKRGGAATGRGTRAAVDRGGKRESRRGESRKGRAGRRALQNAGRQRRDFQANLRSGGDLAECWKSHAGSEPGPGGGGGAERCGRGKGDRTSESESGASRCGDSIRPDGAGAGEGDRIAREVGGGQSCGGRSPGRASGAESSIHHHRRAGQRRDRQEERRSREQYFARGSN